MSAKNKTGQAAKPTSKDTSNSKTDGWFRRRARTDVNETLGITIELADHGRKVLGWVEDLNTGGVKIWCDTNFSIGSECICQLMVGVGDEEVFIRAWVTRSEDNTMALKFDKLSPKTREAIEYCAGPFDYPG